MAEAAAAAAGARTAGQLSARSGARPAGGCSAAAAAAAPWRHAPRFRRATPRAAGGGAPCVGFIAWRRLHWRASARHDGAAAAARGRDAGVRGLRGFPGMAAGLGCARRPALESRSRGTAEPAAASAEEQGAGAEWSIRRSYASSGHSERMEARWPMMRDSTL